MPISTREQLWAHLELAIKVELTTIPPYLYAMYSLEDQHGDAAKLIRSVVVEEMLHAALMGNLLLAVGGTPRFWQTARSVRYPCPLPHHIPELVVNLEPCSLEQIERVFLTIERPEVHEAPPDADNYESLGQFYHAIEQAVERLAATHDLFGAPQLALQLSEPSSYRTIDFDSETSGGLIGITDLETAVAAIETVIHQGEGLSEHRYADPEHRELTHYTKFLALANGTVPLGDVRPAVTNPEVGALPNHVKPVAELANHLYGRAFIAMDELYASTGSEKVVALYAAMDLIGQVGRYLMTLDAGEGRVAGPPFRVPAATPDESARDALARTARTAAVHHPQLAPITAAVENL